MSHSTEPNDKPITPKPKIVQFYPSILNNTSRQYVLTDDGRILTREYYNLPWLDITGEIPE